MIKPSNILDAGIGLFILSNVWIHPYIEKEPLMPFFGSIYSMRDWRMLTSYFFSMAKYGMHGNATSVTKDPEYLYLDGWPKIHENIARYINSSKGVSSPSYCIFVEYANDKYDFIPRKIRIFVGVVPIVTLSIGDDILVHYNINKYILAHKIHLDSRDPNVFIKPRWKHQEKRYYNWD